MADARLGTLRGTWPFKCPVYVVDYELPGVSDVAAIHSRRFFRMVIRIERKYIGTPKQDEILHHEHKHAMDKSHILHFLKSGRKKERRAEAHALAMKGKPVPWI